MKLDVVRDTVFYDLFRNYKVSFYCYQSAICIFYLFEKYYYLLQIAMEM